MSYHEDKENISSSMLKLADQKSLAHVYHQYFSGEPTKETKAMQFGTMFHAYALEKESFDSRFEIMPKGADLRTKAGKELKASIEASGRTAIKEQDFEAAKLMIQSLVKEMQRVGIDYTKGVFETPVYAEKARCKPDVLIVNNAKKLIQIIDLKTCADSSPAEFERASYRLNYHVQAAWYRSILMQHYPGYEIQFIFACVEKSAPYVAQCYQASEQLIGAGWQVCLEQFDNIQRAMQTNEWPGYFEGLGVLELPEWAIGEQVQFETTQGE